MKSVEREEVKVSRFDIVAEDQSGSELQAEQIVCEDRTEREPGWSTPSGVIRWRYQRT